MATINVALHSFLDSVPLNCAALVWWTGKREVAVTTLQKHPPPLSEVPFHISDLKTLCTTLHKLRSQNVSILTCWCVGRVKSGGKAVVECDQPTNDSDNSMMQ